MKMHNIRNSESTLDMVWYRWLVKIFNCYFLKGVSLEDIILSQLARNSKGVSSTTPSQRLKDILSTLSDAADELDAEVEKQLPV